MLYYAAPIFLPLFGAVIAGLFGRVIGARGAQLVTCGAMGVAAVMAIVVFTEVVLQGETATIVLFDWFASGDLDVDWLLRFDELTGVMVFVVCVVSFLIHVYSIGYMAHDPHVPRFFAYLSLFTFFMLALVSADNFLQMFFGWEGVGLVSYLLIGFWYKRPSANAAGDQGLHRQPGGRFRLRAGHPRDLPDVRYRLVRRGVLRRAWHGGRRGHLPRPLLRPAGGSPASCSSSAPWGNRRSSCCTPGCRTRWKGRRRSSALIHAATMVTAGVFMVARLSPIFEYAPIALSVVTFFGATTAIFAATIAITQNDIKRVIAYSTCSQLGYMFFACGVSAYGAGHLPPHHARLLQGAALPRRGAR